MPACLILLAQVLDAMVVASATGPLRNQSVIGRCIDGSALCEKRPTVTIVSATTVDFRMDLIDMRSSWMVCDANQYKAAFGMREPLVRA